MKINKKLNKSASPAPARDLSTGGVVNENDILCGRGNFVNFHSGNFAFRRLVKEYKTEHLQSTKSEKRKYAQIIFDRIKNELNGRFLKLNPEDNTWYEIGEKQAILKIRQALREDAPKLFPNPSKQNQAQESGTPDTKETSDGRMKGVKNDNSTYHVEADQDRNRDHMTGPISDSYTSSQRQNTFYNEDAEVAEIILDLRKQERSCCEETTRNSSYNEPDPGHSNSYYATPLPQNHLDLGRDNNAHMVRTSVALTSNPNWTGNKTLKRYF